MTRSARWCGSVLAVALMCGSAAGAAAQSVVGRGVSGAVPDPIVLAPEGRFQARFVSIGDDLFIGGQPTEAALRDLHTRGVTTVVNLRMPEEMARVGFDEEALLKELGVRYVHIPMRGSPDHPYGPKELDAFAAALASANGKVLLHCTVAWRASHLWGAFLIRERHVPAADAIAHARRINLQDDRPMTAAQHPLEGFLGRPVPEMEHRRPVP